MSIYDQVDEAQKQASKYFKIESGKTAVLKFDEKKISIVDAEFNGEKKKRVRYTVSEANKPFDEKSFELSVTHATQLNALLKKGFMIVEITRRGSGLDTEYTFVPGT